VSLGVGRRPPAREGTKERSPQGGACSDESDRDLQVHASSQAIRCPRPSGGGDRQLTRCGVLEGGMLSIRLGVKTASPNSPAALIAPPAASKPAEHKQ
jgi:hypothetical protein